MECSASNENGQTGRSQTVTVEEVRPVLQLRGEERSNNQSRSNRSPTSQRHSVRWQSDVIDNEHMNKKKTKICCIFHPQQEFDDEVDHHSDCHDSSSSSSSSSSESESEKKLDPAERRQRRVERRHRGLKQNKPPSPNAYEIQPDYTHDRSKRN